MRKILIILLLSASVLCGCAAKESGGGERVKIALYYSDNATLPFKADWLTVRKAEEWFGADLEIQPIPIADYQTKVGLALSTGENAPDAILSVSATGATATLALGGGAAAISDYAEWTPQFNARVKEMGLESAVEALKLGDGKRYVLPALYDQPFYDCGLILRADYLREKGLNAPESFDDLYGILQEYKKDYPNSYPLTTIVAPRVLFRMTMPAFGVSLGLNSATDTGVLSWDYAREEYFKGATSEEYRAYAAFLAKLYAEGLLDPEMTQDATATAQKLARGDAMAVYGYYDQIGGWSQGAKEGFELRLYPPLTGPAGARSQPKSRVGAGILFTAKAQKRADFEQVVRKIDEIFFSERGEILWCVGAENESYTLENGEYIYAPEVVSAPEGVYKAMQIKYGCGCDGLQLVWRIERELTKYDDAYAEINRQVAAMEGAIQPLPPAAKLSEAQAEEASLLKAALSDLFETWNDAFITGRKSPQADFDEYAAQMERKGLSRYLEIYNAAGQ